MEYLNINTVVAYTPRMSLRSVRRIRPFLCAALFGTAALAGAQSATPACAGQLVRDVTGQVCIPKAPKRIVTIEWIIPTNVPTIRKRKRRLVALKLGWLTNRAVSIIQ